MDWCRHDFPQNFTRFTWRCPDSLCYCLASIAIRLNPLFEQSHSFATASGEREKDALPDHDIARRPKPQHAIADRDLFLQFGVIRWERQKKRTREIFR